MVMDDNTQQTCLCARGCELTLNVGMGPQSCCRVSSGVHENYGADQSLGLKTYRPSDYYYGGP